MTKNDFKAMAKRAQKITNLKRYTSYGGVCFMENTQVSYREMHLLLMKCDQWVAYLQEDGKTILVNGTVCSFRVEM